MMRTSRKIVIAGGSGFLGQGLAGHLADSFDTIVVLTRGASRHEGAVQYVNWDARTIGRWADALDGAEAVVNLVGRSVDCRKMPRNRAIILNSRIDSVQAIGQALRQCTRPPGVWIQAATAHIYGDTGDETLDESSPIGTGFAPMVGTAWEDALRTCTPPGMRTVTLRISFVLGRHGGALQTLARLARFGLGGQAGAGRQYVSWIHEEDLHRLIAQAIDDVNLHGIYVVTAPEPQTNRDFMRQLRRACHRPWSPPVPGWVVRAGSVILRTDAELVLLGRRCVPTRLLNEGFTFRHPQLAGALSDLLAPSAD